MDYLGIGEMLTNRDVNHFVHKIWKKYRGKKNNVHPLEIPGYLHKMVMTFNLLMTFNLVPTIDKHSLLKLITHKQCYIFMSLLNTPCKHGFNDWLTLLWQQLPQPNVFCSCGSDLHNGQEEFWTISLYKTVSVPQYSWDCHALTLVIFVSFIILVRSGCDEGGICVFVLSRVFCNSMGFWYV